MEMIRAVWSWLRRLRRGPEAPAPQPEPEPEGIPWPPAPGPDGFPCHPLDSGSPAEVGAVEVDSELKPGEFSVVRGKAVRTRKPVPAKPKAKPGLKAEPRTGKPVPAKPRKPRGK